MYIQIGAGPVHCISPLTFYTQISLLIPYSQIGVTSTLAELATDIILKRLDDKPVGVVRPPEEVGVGTEVGVVLPGSGMAGVGVRSMSRDWPCVTTVWWGRMNGSDIWRRDFWGSGL